MDVFKITPGYQEIHKISEATFTEETKLVPPYKEGNSYRAVCPECDNPIILVGLFKPTPESGRKPYGRHHKGSISELAVYREDEYENCIYANPSWKKSKVKRSANSEAGKVLLRIMREQFDRIVYILEKSIEIKISKSFAEKMLTCYLDAEGWLYNSRSAGISPQAVSSAADAVRRILHIKIRPRYVGWFYANMGSAKRLPTLKDVPLCHSGFAAFSINAYRAKTH